MPSNSNLSSQVTAKGLSFEFSNGDLLFSDLSFSLGNERHGLVGPNGVGKSTLARILSGELNATSGEIKITRSVCYLEQHQDPPSELVSEFLSELWESAFANPEVWGPLLHEIPLDQSLRSLSGGQWMRVRIAKALALNTGLLILDEPTNNLDRSARILIADFVKSYQGSLLVISHDRELLNYVDKVLEISNQGLEIYGGNHAFYQERKKIERDLQELKLEKARKEKAKTEREFHEKMVSQDKRIREGDKKGKSGSLPRILVGGLKRRAQETRGKIHINEDKRVEKAKIEFRQIFQNSKRESHLDLSLPETSVPEGKVVFEIENANIRYAGSERNVWKENITLAMKGPRRWAIAGDNGSGKSSLVRSLLEKPAKDSFQIEGMTKKGELPVAVLDQNYSCLDFGKSVLDNVMEKSRYDLVETRNLLARFQFMGEKSLQSVNTLSGGEKLKASLAKILLAEPAPRFLILDEPTNNLDLQSLDVLEGVLLEYQGALLVISHDEVFLQNIGIEKIYFIN